MTFLSPDFSSAATKKYARTLRGVDGSGRARLLRNARGAAVTASGLRVGTDVESIADVELALARFGARYAQRLFTQHEISSCGGVGPLAAPGLAARFAAKEAMIKVLRPTDVVPRWRCIEVRRDPGGWTEIALSDEAAELAQRAGISQVAVSLSHGAGVGTATVVALTGSETRRQVGMG